MSKYSKDIKLIAVRRYLQSNESSESIASKLGVDHTSLRLWIRHYKQHGTAAFEKKYTHYSAQFKLSVLRYVQQHGCSYKKAATKFDIRNPSSIANWSRCYQTGGFEALKPKRKGRSPSMARKKSVRKPDSALSREELMKELEFLRAENAFLKKYDALLQEEEKAVKRKPSRSKD